MILKVLLFNFAYAQLSETDILVCKNVNSVIPTLCNWRVGRQDDNCEFPFINNPQYQEHVKQKYLLEFSGLEYLCDGEYMGEVYVNKTTIQARSSSHSFQSLQRFIPNFEKLRGYGCWCDMENEMSVGRGEPVNDIDHACMDLHNSIKCLGIDSINHGEQCSYRDTSYRVAPVMNDRMIDLACTMANRRMPNPECAKNICKIEANFLLFFLKRAFTGKRSFDEKYLHHEFGGQFDKELCNPSLVTKSAQSSDLLTDYYGNNFMDVIDFDNFDAGNTIEIPFVNPRAVTKSAAFAFQDSNLKCCGNHPKRYPYHSNTQACCMNELIYSIPAQECCTATDTVEIVSYGTC